MTQPADHENRWEEAIAKRLSKLASIPIDTRRLDLAIRAQIGSPHRQLYRHWLASLSAIAASLVLIVAIAFGVLGQSRQAQASPTMIAQMHQDIISGKIPTVRADSIDEANRAIAAFGSDFPQLPEPPASHTMACCMQKIGDKKVACVLLNNGGTPVTVAIAHASEVESPKSPTVVRNGVSYHVQAVGDLHMVMGERDRRWVCLIGQLPEDKLMDLADSIRF